MAHVQQNMGGYLYPTLYPQLTFDEGQTQVGLVSPPTSRSLILWPPGGDNIRIYSLISKKRDGFLRVKDESIGFLERNTLVVDAKGKLDKSNSLFRFFSTRERSQQLQVHDSVDVWLGIPGERLGRDRKYIYMLKTKRQGDDKIIVAKGFKKNPVDETLIPQIDAASEAELLKFRIDYEGNGLFSIRDNEQWNHLDEGPPKHHHLRVNAGGDIRRVRRNPRLGREEYNHPGMLFYIMHLGNDSDLADGD